MQNARYSVFELTVSFKYRTDRVDRGDVTRIAKAVHRLSKAAKHSHHAVSLVVLSDETAAQLMDRIRPQLSTIGSIEDFWVQTVGIDAIGQHGVMDPFTTYVRELWTEANKRNKSKHFRQPRPEDIFVKHGVKEFNRKAAVEMGLRGPWKGKRPTNSNNP